MKHYIPKTKIGKQLHENKRDRIVFFACCGLMVNILYAFYHGILGLISQSVWLITLCAYYGILGIMRFSTMMFERRNRRQNRNTELCIMKFCGAFLIVLAVVLSGSVYLSLTRDIAVSYPETMMITIAAYTFYKITLAVINVIKTKKEHSPLLSTIRSIACADAAASVLSLQRSMLASFEGKSAGEIYAMNGLTGAAVFFFIVLLGISMLIKKPKRSH